MAETVVSVQMSATATVGYVIGASIGLCVGYAIVRAIVIGAQVCFWDFLGTFCCCFDLSGKADAPKPKSGPYTESTAPDLTALKQTNIRPPELSTDRHNPV